MSGLSEMLIGEPWMRRVRAESGGQDSPTTDADNAPQDAPNSAVVKRPPGWDPYEVWLHRIQRPRKPRGGEES